MSDEVNLTEAIARQRRLQGISPDGLVASPPRIGEIVTPENVLKPIETKYAGYKFRSRLEARYAVMFDALKVRWKYEHEGFDLGEAGFYLPDFWLEDRRLFVEVKPTEPSDEELAKAKALNSQSGCQVLICVGTPGDDDEKCIEIPPTKLYVGMGRLNAAEMFGDTGSLHCPICKTSIREKKISERALSFECGNGCRFTLRFGSNSFAAHAYIEEAEYLVSGLDMLGKNLNYAKAQARMARFEHGQSGSK